MENFEMVVVQGGGWRCTNAGDWFGVAAVALTAVALVASGPIGIIAGVWGTLSSASGGIIGAGNLIAGC